jgi:TldD protein
LLRATRRRFVQAGTALLTVPGALVACGRPNSHPSVAPTDTTSAAAANPFAAWFSVDEAVMRQVLAELTARGADDAELYFQHTRSNAIAMEDGVINRASASIELGVGLRVVIGDQVGYAYSEDLGKDAMMSAARAAAAIARGQAVAAPAAFHSREHARFYRLEVPWSEVGVEDKLPIVQKVAALARAKDSAIDKVSVHWSDEDEHVMIADMRGNIVCNRRPLTTLNVRVTARRGTGKAAQSQSNGSALSARRGLDFYDDANLEKVAREAVDRTMVLFEARKPPAGEMAVVLAAGASGILLHEAVGHGMEADFNRKDTSIYASMLGKRVAPEFVTIVDDGTIANERGALDVDDEGRECERTVLVENGILASYLHDSISARHYGLKQSTGSGRRESFRHAPMPRMRCTFMENGPHTKDEIIASVERGIIAETFTNGEVQIGAGDFTFYIKNGWLIENGKVTAPVRDCNIIGNGPEALQRVTMAANDSKLDTGTWTCGKNGQGVPVSQGLPTVLVSRMTVGGSDA